LAALALLDALADGDAAALAVAEASTPAFAADAGGVMTDAVVAAGTPSSGGDASAFGSASRAVGLSENIATAATAAMANKASTTLVWTRGAPLSVVMAVTVACSGAGGSGIVPPQIFRIRGSVRSPANGARADTISTIVW
jgi:hypothetical protein